MKWWVFALVLYVTLALQMSLAEGVGILSRFGPLTPRFDLLLAVLVGLWAPAELAFVAWGILGFCCDLLSPRPEGLTLVGPYALAYLGGAYVMIQVRPMLLRTHPMAMGFMVLAAGGAVQLLVVAIFTLRLNLGYGPEGFSGGDELVQRAASLIYTALLALVLAKPMQRLLPPLGLSTQRLPGGWGRRR